MNIRVPYDIASAIQTYKDSNFGDIPTIKQLVKYYNAIHLANVTESWMRNKIYYYGLSDEIKLNPYYQHKKRKLKISKERMTTYNKDQLKMMALEVLRHNPAIDFKTAFDHIDDIIENTDADLIIDKYIEFKNAQKENFLNWLEETAPAKKNPFLD